jgi:hypothetical protein
MNHLEKVVANRHDILDQLCSHDVLLSRRHDLEAYLVEYPDLASILGDVCEKVRAAFGSATELSLELYRDPEIDDRYLTLYLRQESYSSDFIDRIDAVCAEFHSRLETAEGYFLVTTDFRRPGEVHVV